MQSNSPAQLRFPVMYEITARGSPYLTTATGAHSNVGQTGPQIPRSSKRQRVCAGQTATHSHCLHGMDVRPGQRIPPVRNPLEGARSHSPLEFRVSATESQPTIAREHTADRRFEVTRHTLHENRQDDAEPLRAPSGETVDKLDCRPTSFFLALPRNSGDTHAPERPGETGVVE